MTEVRKAERCSSYDGNNQYTVEFFVDGECVTEPEYRSIMEIYHSSKRNAGWFDFTQENLDELLQ